MPDPYIGEIKIFAGTFAPTGRAACNGASLPIAQNTALYSIIGTIYGGDGKVNFDVPNLQRRAPMHPGSVPGLTPRRIGQYGGAAFVALSETEMASHTHSLNALTAPATMNIPAAGSTDLARSANGNAYQDTTQNLVSSNPAMLLRNGGTQAHNNLQPALSLYFIIALEGTDPSKD